MIYVSIFLALIFIAFLHDFMNVKTGRALSYFGAYLTLVSLSAFRYKVGGDTYSYMYAHNFLPDLSHLFSTEVGIAKLQPLWLLFTAISKSISEEFYVLQSLHAILVNAAIFIFIRQNTRYCHTGILFYYFALYPYFNFEILRESLAIAIFLTSIKYYNANRWVTYYSLATLAFLFHISAIILFIIPLIKSINVKPSFIPLIFVIAAALNPIILNLASTPLATALLGYAAGYAGYNYTIFGLASLFLFFVLNPLIIFVSAKHIFKINIDYYSIASKGLFIVSMTPLLFIFSRFYNYFSILFVLMAVEILHKLYRSKKNKPLRPATVPLLFLCFFSIYTFRYIGDTSNLASGTRWYSYWIPYYSILDPRVDDDRERLIDAMRMQIQ